MSHQSKSHQHTTAGTSSQGKAGASTPGGTSNKPEGNETVEHIRQRAYEISVKRNGGSGDQLSDWLQAEHDVNGKHSKTKGNDSVAAEIKTHGHPSPTTSRGGL